MNNNPVIIGLLQNPWFRPKTPAHIIERYRTDQVFHRHVLARSMSGRRLVKAFGRWYDKIYWDNVATDHATTSSGRTSPDTRHVTGLIESMQPHIIITFGAVATNTVRDVLNKMYVSGFHHPHAFLHVESHHPNARHMTQDDLNDRAEIVVVAAEALAKILPRPLSQRSAT